jgi:hypothetical protein
MKIIKIFTILTFALNIFILTNCNKEDESKKNGFSSPEEYIVNPSVKNALKESNVPVYEGDNPPALAGTYSADGYVTDASYEMSDIIGAPIQSEIVLSKQTTSGKIDFEERVSGIKVSGSGGYITGDNGRFTIYQESKQSGSEAGLPDGVTLTVVLMMSGTKSSNGNLVGVEGISIVTEVNNSSYKKAEGWWWKWNADFYLQTGSKSSSSLKSATNSNEQLLLQKALQIIMEQIK